MKRVSQSLFGTYIAAGGPNCSLKRDHGDQKEGNEKGVGRQRELKEAFLIVSLRKQEDDSWTFETLPPSEDSPLLGLGHTQSSKY